MKVIDNNTFIKKASIIHNNKYDYSKVDYINTKTKVIIICPIHGEFLQTPNSHLKGRGCPNCKHTPKNKHNTKWFIEKAREKHGDRYDYSESIYIGLKHPINISCPDHGIFKQIPYNHINGAICPICQPKPNKRKKSEEFIKQANQIHNNFYDYSEANYLNSTTKIKIICPIHGPFWQTPKNHLHGHGCYECGRIKTSSFNKLTSEIFIQRAEKTHGSKYDYSQVEYLTSKDDVKIICPIHGEFYQQPNHHINGCGCPSCSNVGRKDSETFNNEASIIHNNKYDYSEVEYKNSQTKVKIICPHHGAFLQRPNRHLQGDGCPKCSGQESSKELKIRKLLQLKGIDFKHNIVVDERYPWKVDIYIPNRDLFLEYNGFYSHGKEWYDLRKKSTKKQLNYLENNPSPLNSAALKTFSKSDVLKRKTAKKNNLNYVVLWNDKDIEDWFALGCPDGHDGNGMYTWKKDSK